MSSWRSKPGPPLLLVFRYPSLSCGPSCGACRSHASCGVCVSPAPPVWSPLVGASVQLQAGRGWSRSQEMGTLPKMGPCYSASAGVGDRASLLTGRSTCFGPGNALF